MLGRADDVGERTLGRRSQDLQLPWASKDVLARDETEMKVEKDDELTSISLFNLTAK